MARMIRHHLGDSRGGAHWSDTKGGGFRLICPSRVLAKTRFLHSWISKKVWGPDWSLVEQSLYHPMFFHQCAEKKCCVSAIWEATFWTVHFVYAIRECGNLEWLIICWIILFSKIMPSQTLSCRENRWVRSPKNTKNRAAFIEELPFTCFQVKSKHFSIWPPESKVTKSKHWSMSQTTVYKHSVCSDSGEQATFNSTLITEEDEVS